MSKGDGTLSRRQKLTNLIGLALLALTFAWALSHVGWQTFGISGGPLGGGRKVITVVHWQLEGRTVEAMQWAADEYMKLHPDVYIQQIAVPTSAYEQWVRTQLIGRTAPDLIEMRGTEDWDNLAVRYFVPMPSQVDQPNPYNAGTDLEGLPWRETYLDGMMGGFRATLQEYYCAPLSMFTVRIYANRDLLEQVAREVGDGQVREPRTLREYMALCDDIRAYSARKGEKIVPVAGSEDVAGQFRWKYLGMAFGSMLDLFDWNRDGDIEPGIALEAAMTGTFPEAELTTLDEPFDLRTSGHIRAGHMVLYDICRQFNKGFTACKRDQSISMFAQGKAAMIATGSWEAGSLYREVGEDFEIMVFDFPVSEPDHPLYGPYLQLRPTEAGQQSGFPMGITRFSKHPDVALDFLHFLTGQRINEDLNRRFRWFPAIQGAEPDDVLAAFEPKVEGVYMAYTTNHLSPGAGTALSYEQGWSAYIGQDEPTEGEYREFLALCQRDRKAFTDTHGPLADRFLDACGDNPASCSYQTFLEIWRLQHYQSFMDAYAAAYERQAMDDFARRLDDAYSALARSETGLANARALAVQRGLTDRLDEDIRRNLTAVTFGQVQRIMLRADGLMRHDRVRRTLAERAEPKEAGK
ncbi:MAG: extracellular solute-binding protein [Planctomycetes bacterium]|nr:extracellular solute-binding protein [Planctomycetota bacterium]